MEIGFRGVVAVACMGLAVGCSSTGPTITQPGSSSSDVQAGKVAVVIPAPFAALTDQQSREAEVIHQAIEHKTAVCMQAAGFKYTPAVFPEPIKPSVSVFGDVDNAEKNGYGLVDNQAVREDGVILENEDLKGASQQQVSAYYLQLLGPSMGDETGKVSVNQVSDENRVVTKVRNGAVVYTNRQGCLNIARAEVSGDLEVWAGSKDFIGDLDYKLGQAVSSDQRYLTADEVWRKCMATAGLGDQPRIQYAQKLFEDIRKFAGDARKMSELRAAEVKIATIGAKCDRESSIGEIVKELQSEHEKKILAENQGLVIVWSETNAASGQRARSILGLK